MKDAQKKDAQITRMPLENLRPHPLQTAFYSDCSEADDAALAADLRQRGQQSPIVVMPEGNAAGLPPGTIMDGCRRAAAMIANREIDAAVVIRFDLLNADAATVEAEFLNYNFSRRQLHPLDRARVAQRLYLCERHKKTVKSLGSKEGLGLRERLGQILKMSGRNLDRYLRVMETPLPVQNAVRDGRLKLVLGAKIASLPKPTQEAIADAIAGLMDSKLVTEIVSRYVQVPSDRRHQKPNDAVRCFALTLERGLEDLKGRIDEIGAAVVRRNLDTFRRARHVISTLIAKADPGDEWSAGTP